MHAVVVNYMFLDKYMLFCTGRWSTLQMQCSVSERVTKPENQSGCKQTIAKRGLILLTT